VRSAPVSGQYLSAECPLMATQEAFARSRPKSAYPCKTFLSTPKNATITSRAMRRPRPPSPLSHDPQRIIGQWPLQRQRVERIGLRPTGRTLGHGLGMNGRDGRVGLRRQEAEQFMLALDQGLLGPRTFQSGYVCSTCGV
jgi:hypothetical protein